MNEEEPLTLLNLYDRAKALDAVGVEETKGRSRVRLLNAAKGTLGLALLDSQVLYDNDGKAYFPFARGRVHESDGRLFYGRSIPGGYRTDQIFGLAHLGTILRRDERPSCTPTT